MGHRSPVAFIVCLTSTLMAAAQSSNLNGIAHAALRVSDVDKSRNFYVKLGFEQAFQFEESGRVTQSFLKINDRQFIELYPRTEESQTIGLMHICYEADHIEEVRSAYVNRGVSAPEAKKARAGNLLLVMNDPEGQIVEYTQYLPGSLHWEDHGKHLGEQRVSTHLASVTIPVRDLGTERAFYVEKLGFDRTRQRGTQTVLLIPGSDDAIALASTADMHQTELRFTVASATEANEKVRTAGLRGQMHDGAVVVIDPDGNTVVLQGKLNHADLQR
jgi:catechol 2,3-dioxygenase-like lactoylglutathione lyase family enzyme